MKNITIVGYYGKNLGDIIFLYGLVNYFKNNKTIKNISVLSYAKQLDPELLAYLQKNNVNLFYLGGRSTFQKLKNIIESLRGSSLVLWGGGSCFFDNGGTCGFKTFILAWLLGKKNIYLGIGIETIKTSKMKVIIFISYLISYKIFFRDNDSLIAMKRILNIKRARNKLRVIPDLSILEYRYLANKIKTPYNEYIAISIRDNDGALYDSIIKNIILTLLKKAKLNLVIIFNTDEEVDKRYNQIIAEYLKNNNIQTIYFDNITFDEKIKIINQSSFVLTSRLHVAIVARYSLIPFLAINYSTKILNMGNTMDCEQNIIDLKTFLNYEKIDIKNFFLKEISLEIIRKNLITVLNQSFEEKSE